MVVVGVNSDREKMIGTDIMFSYDASKLEKNKDLKIEIGGKIGGDADGSGAVDLKDLVIWKNGYLYII